MSSLEEKRAQAHAKAEEYLAAAAKARAASRAHHAPVEGIADFFHHDEPSAEGFQRSLDSAAARRQGVLEEKRAHAVALGEERLRCVVRAPWQRCAAGKRLMWVVGLVGVACPNGGNRGLARVC